MTLNTKSKFTNRRTYVVKVHSPAKPGVLTGRVENFVTGQQHEFASSHELIESILNDLDSTEESEST